MKIWRMLAALCMIGALVFCFAACGAAPVEPSTEPTEETVDATADATEETEPLVDPETFKAFIGTWYADGSSASYRIIIDKKATWNFTDAAGTVLHTGSVVVSEDNQAISLCDADTVQIFDLTMEEEGKVYVETYLELESLTSSYFLNKITNDEPGYSTITEEESTAELPVEEAPVVEEDTSAAEDEEVVD